MNKEKGWRWCHCSVCYCLCTLQVRGLFKYLEVPWFSLELEWTDKQGRGHSSVFSPFFLPQCLRMQVVEFFWGEKKKKPQNLHNRPSAQGKVCVFVMLVKPFCLPLAVEYFPCRLKLESMDVQLLQASANVCSHESCADVVCLFVNI